MTEEAFIEACTARRIDPSIAMENELVRRFLEERKDNIVIEVLDTEF
jgi:hypothetical protein